MAGFKLDVTTNANAAVADFKKLGGSLEDVGDTLGDVARDGDKAGDRLEASFRDMAREAKQADQTVKDTGDSFRKMGDKGSEVSSELRQNLGETFSSFRGDLEDLPQIAQDTLGGLAGSGALGGLAGLAATAAGAAGLGLIVGALDAAGERSQRLQEEAADLAQAYIDAGTNVLSAVDQAARVNDVVGDPERYKKAKDFATVLGVDMPTALRAVAGDIDATNLLWDAYTAKTEKALETGRQGSPIDISKMNDARNAINDLKEVNEMALQSAADYSDTLKQLVADADRATEEVDALGNAVYTLPDGTKIMVHADTGKATTDLAKFKGDADGIAQTVIEPLIRPRVDTSAWDTWQPRQKHADVVVNAQKRSVAWE